ncbi:response regulator [Anaerosporobacter sp.]|uniref:response regulator n=1 Tax=Anaerosporobacter sp. TaxID=1872529 RepID=UPI00286F4F0C|nr:response regulator [Anaerosporobacter sp.]
MQPNASEINILIVDDTPEHILMASAILKQCNYTIRAAHNGYSALKQIEIKMPTLILLDINMPDLSGYEVCRMIKENPDYKHIAIIFMTSSNHEESIQRGFECGATDYVVKPYHARELLARVNTHVKIVTQSLELTHAYKELDQFCHSVSHDLKSPLQVINQLCFMLGDQLDSPVSPSQEEIISRLHNKCDQVILMIERLLDFSKMTALPCSLDKVNLNTLFQTTISELLLLEGKRSITVTQDTLPVVQGDSSLLALLAQNVIGNAIKFTRTQATASIQIHYELQQHFHVITIQDNGVGFDSNYSNKLFHVFERLHTKEEFEGSGVGLAIVARIMKRHGGFVSITGALGKGATVTLKFPL